METPDQSFILTHKAFQIGSWQVAPRQLHLYRDNEQRRLTPKMMEVLVYLADRQGQVVTKDELMTAVWGSVYVSEGAIRRTVSQVRQLLDDDPSAPRYIETVPRVGYRLIAEISGVDFAGHTVVNTDTRIAGPRTNRHSFPSIPYRWMVPIVVLVLTGMLAMMGRDNEAPITPLVRKQVTSFHGDELSPALSPDGKQVAFAHVQQSGDALKTDLYVKMVDEESFLQLTDNPTFETSPAWSPDGLHIAYVGLSSQPESCTIYRIAVLGGLPRKLTECTLLPDGSPPRLSWSPDGGSLVFPHSGAENELPRLYRFDLANKSATPLSPPGEGEYDRSPRFAEQSGRLAAIRRKPGDFSSILIFEPGSDTDPDEIYSTKVPIWSVHWAADEQALYFVGEDERYQPALWRLSRSGSVLRRLSLPSEIQIGMQIALQDDRLLYNQMDIEADLWRLNLESNQSSRLPVSSTRHDLFPSLSPSGNQLAFFSDRNGEINLWVTNSENGTPRILTSWTDTDFTPPVWSADGAMLFVGSSRGISGIDVATGERDMHTEDQPLHLILSSENDLIYSIESAGGAISYRLPYPYDASPTLFSDSLLLRGGYKDLVFGTRPGKDSVLVRSKSESSPFIPLDFSLSDAATAPWVFTSNGFYYTTSKGNSELRFFDFESHTSQVIASLPGGHIRTITFSPDGLSLVYDLVVTRGIDILMVEHFDQGL